VDLRIANEEQNRYFESLRVVASWIYGSMGICGRSTQCCALEIKDKSSSKCWRRAMRVMCAGRDYQRVHSAGDGHRYWSVYPFACVIHAYPAQVEALRKVTDADNRTHLMPTIQSLLWSWLQ